MKMMPTHELIAVIEKMCPNIISQETVNRIFNTFGDDYFMDPGGEWELTKTNQNRVDLIEKCLNFTGENHDQG